jgi:hypothetical protein
MQKICIYSFGIFWIMLYVLQRYTSKMLMTTIDEHHKGTYDFVYLPIDFRVSVFSLLMFNIFRHSFLFLLIIHMESTLIAEQMQCWICIYQHD